MTPPLLWPSALCLSRSPGQLNRRPKGRLLWVLAFSTASCHQRVSKLHRGSRYPLLLVDGFPYHILSPTCVISNSLGGPLRRAVAFSTSSCLWLLWFPTRWIPVPTELYNSSIAHSIFGMACLIVIERKYLSCSSEVTLFKCISLWVYHGLLPCSISSAKSAYAISFDYWPLECVTSFRCITLEWHVWPGRRPIYNRNPIPLPQWFIHGNNDKLTKFSNLHGKRSGKRPILDFKWVTKKTINTINQKAVLHFLQT